MKTRPPAPLPDEPRTSGWTPSQIEQLSVKNAEIPLIRAMDVRPVLPGFDVWDVWPLQDEGNGVARIGEGEIWFCLAVPELPAPEMRHDVARTRALFRLGSDWHDLGYLFPDDLNPGSREWSGSALFIEESRSIIAYFTAAGRQGEDARTFEQRMFMTRGTLDDASSLPTFGGWSPAREIAPNDGRFYHDVGIDPGVPGNLKGYRDPGFFIDPQGGGTYVYFAASLAQPRYGHDAAIGVARAAEPVGPFTLLQPVINADGVSSEMERPHAVYSGGQYYLFWSCHGASFAPDGPRAPTGLYGMVGPSPLGPFTPLNGSGLVLANPGAEPFQAYCWQVTDRLEVLSFVNYWGLEGRAIDTPSARRNHFGGTIAPSLKLKLAGARTSLEQASDGKSK